jgi:hypothetical protein
MLLYCKVEQYVLFSATIKSAFLGPFASSRIWAQNIKIQKGGYPTSQFIASSPDCTLAKEPTLALVVLLVHADAHGQHHGMIDTGRDGERVRLLAEQEIPSAEELPVDAPHHHARLLVDDVGRAVEPVALHLQRLLAAALGGAVRKGCPCLGSQNC